MKRLFTVVCRPELRSDQEMSISQNDTLHDAQAQMIEACSESVAREPKDSRPSRLFASLPYNGLLRIGGR
jgi:hypothetical protein